MPSHLIYGLGYRDSQKLNTGDAFNPESGTFSLGASPDAYIHQSAVLIGEDLGFSAIVVVDVSNSRITGKLLCV